VTQSYGTKATASRCPPGRQRIGLHRSTLGKRMTFKLDPAQNVSFAVYVAATVSARDLYRFFTP